MKRDGPKAPSTIHGLSGLRFLPTEEANAIADCLENRFTPHDLCDERHEERVETCVQALLEVEDDTVTERVRPCDKQKLIHPLNLGKVYVTDGIPRECLRHLPRRPFIHLTHFFNHCFRHSYFPFSWVEAKVVALPKPG